MPHDPKMNNEQKDELPISLGMSRAKYVILRWLAGILLLIVASALWWWPRYVDGHFPKIQRPSSAESKVETHIPLSAEHVVKPEEQGVIARLADVEEKLRTLDEKFKRTMVEGMVSQSLTNPEIGVEEALNDIAEQKVLVLKALFKIERAIQQGRPFQTLFQAFKSKASWLESISDTLSVLESVAEGGAPTLRHLQEQFAESKMMTKSTLFETFRLNHIADALLSLIHIEKINDNTKSEYHETPQLSRLMEAGDVAAAVESIDALGSAERQAYDAWLMQAKLYLDVQEAFDTVLAEVITRNSKRTKSTPNVPKDNEEIHTGVSQ